MTDLKLALDPSNGCAQENTNYVSGVGANAASRQEMTFVATDCLSELVWSPNNGLSLKCAVAVVPEKRNSFFCGIGPSDMVLLSSHSVEEGSFCDKVKEEREVCESPLNCVVREEGDETPFSSASKSHTVDVQTCKFDIGCQDGSSGADAQERAKGLDEGLSENLATNPNALDLDERYVVPMVTDVADVKKSESVGEKGVNNQVYPICPVRDSTLCEPLAQCKHDVVDSMMLSQPSRCREIHDVDEAFGEECLKEPFSRGTLECTDENDLRPSGDAIPDSAVDLRKDSNKGSIQLEDSDPVIKASPIRALVSIGKGKEKALSDGDIKERASEDEDDSNASVESCNSAGLIYGKRKRFLSFEQQLIGGSKRIKRQSHGNPVSILSLTKCNSSFTNWMSTMIKGLSNSKAESAASLALPLAEHNIGNVNQCSKGLYCRPSNMGFQSIFRSLYTANPKFLDQGLPSPCSQLEGRNEHDDVNNPCEAEGPISVPYNSEAIKEIAESSQRPDQCMVGDGEDPLVDLKALKENLSAPLSDFKTDVAATPIKCAFLGKDHEIVRDPRSSPNLAFVKKLKDDGLGTHDVRLPSEENTARDTTKKKDPLTSLWVTRLYSNACSAMDNPIKSKQSARGTLEPGSGDPRFADNPQNNSHFLHDSNVVAYKKNLLEEPSSPAYKKSQSVALGIEAHTNIERIESQEVADSALPPLNFASSEDMASFFAKRLDAFRQMSPSNIPENDCYNSRACLFCGLKGHDLQDCSQVSETELAELMRNISAYGGAEESPCLCIRCLAPNHWAVACPNVAPKKSCPLDTSRHGRLHPIDTKNLFGFGKALNLQDSINHRFLELEEKTGDSSSQGFHKIPNTTGILSSGPKIVAASTSMNWVSTSIPQRDSALKHKEIAPTVTRLFVRNTPKDIFEAIKKLRLSRSDLLKGMSNPSSMPRLNGYYLRLRLGKWERGLRGTGYYVACIAGSRGGNESMGGRRDSIPVIVRGMRCLVESHNISNKDFLEDELVAWWSGLLRDGGMIPSEDDLRSKWEERRRLGF